MCLTILIHFYVNIQNIDKFVIKFFFSFIVLRFSYKQGYAPEILLSLFTCRKPKV